MHQFETKFEIELESVRHDARVCLNSIYSELTFHHVVGSDVELRALINEHASYWMAVLSAQQTAGIVSMGRLYDRTCGATTIGTLLNRASEYPGIFSRAAIQARKSSVLGTEEAKRYAADAYEPKRGYLDPWQNELERLQQNYVARVQPLRHGVFAHNRGPARREIDDLFAGLLVVDFQEIAVFALRVGESLWQLFHNGRDPRMEDYPSPLGVSEILANPPGQREASWHEHRHVVASTNECLQWLKRIDRSNQPTSAPQ